MHYVCAIEMFVLTFFSLTRSIKMKFQNKRHTQKQKIYFKYKNHKKFLKYILRYLAAVQRSHSSNNALSNFPSRNLSFTVLWHGFQYYTTTATTNTWAHHYAACCRRFLEQVKKALNTSQQSWQSCLQSNIILAAASMHYCMCSMMTLIIHLSIFCIYTIEDVLWINTFMMKWESWTKCYWWR